MNLPVEKPKNFTIIILIVFFLISCKEKEPLFKLLDSKTTGIDFQNTLIEGPNTNILMYEYFYNGGGVSAADFNGDGLDDLYFTSNMGENKLYINKGNLKFNDATATSGADGKPGPWKTGINAVDINSDGKMDLYLCYSGAMPAEKRKNQLFINKGNDTNNIPIFEEKAEEFGLASSGFSNQSYFLDYDVDGDLDMLLLNHNPKNLPLLNQEGTKKLLATDSPDMGLRFFKNTNNFFSDITKEVGINGSELSYGLGLGISDLNLDGYPDFYVSNDYSVPDRLYINQKNGSFKDESLTQLGHISQFSMGNDLADFDNDGLIDVFTLDMLPEDNKRQKLLVAPDNFAKFELNLNSGFHHQYMRNMLHKNNGNGTFSEIGQMAGLSNTDWSWSALFADFDNDGHKDLHVSNGYVKDYTNLDFIKYMDDFVAQKGRLQREDVKTLIEKMPASNVSNYIFKNKADQTFDNFSKNWGLERPSNSTGAAYSDLDNDGDLDIIVNNINQASFIYENTASKTNFLKINLKGEKGNLNAYGTKIILKTAQGTQVLEQNPARGYLSSSSQVLHFGLGSTTTIKELQVIWPNKKTQKLNNIKPNQTLTLDINNAIVTQEYKKSEETQNFELVHSSPIPKVFNDFERQLLMPLQQSYTYAPMATADFNADGVLDFILGGLYGQSTQIFFNSPSGKFSKTKSSVFEADVSSHDTDIEILDVNNDKLPDIYISTGGYHDFQANDERLADKLYINLGKGEFKKTALPLNNLASNTVCAADINADNFVDLFVGGGIIPGQYPKNEKSYFLINDKKGGFIIKPLDQDLGQVTGAEFTDLNADKRPELITVGPFEPLRILSVEGKDISNEFLSEKSPLGWWTSLKITDLNADGKTDIFCGNLGLNTQFKNNPLELKSINKNGIKPLLAFTTNGQKVPFFTRDELIEQIPSFKTQYTDYQSFSEKTFNDLFNEKLEDFHKEINETRSVIYLGTKEKKFSKTIAPNLLQTAPVNAVLKTENGFLTVSGNDNFKIRIGKIDANYLIHTTNENGNFSSKILNHKNLKHPIVSVLDLGNKIVFRDKLGSVYSMPSTK